VESHEKQIKLKNKKAGDGEWNRMRMRIQIQIKVNYVFFFLGGASKKHLTKNIKRTDARELIDWDKKIE